jgi:hypothetical protein
MNHEHEAGAAKARARVHRCPEYERLKKTVLENLKEIGRQFSRADRGACSADVYYEAFGNILITLTHAAAAHGISPEQADSAEEPARQTAFRLIHGGKAGPPNEQLN